jgi:L-seryl-tRNA(Ser) seleniumtransferase
VDKMTLAALEGVLADHDAGRAVERAPVLRMLALGEKELRERASGLAAALRAAAPGLRIEVSPGKSAVGGGAAPTLELPTSLVTLAHPRLTAAALARALRAADPPVIARVAEGRVVLDPRTIAGAEEAEIVAIVKGLAHSR